MALCLDARSPAAAGSRLPFHDVLVQYGPAYLKQFGDAMPARQYKVLHKLLACRTEAMGGSLFYCAHCAKHHYTYHSCNDRHCPQCGQAQTEEWLERQQHRLLLPVPFFLVTFTLPEPVQRWMRSHPKVGYDVLFAASAKALQDLAQNPKRLGASLGMLGVLHTWSRTLTYHPHVHYLVPGGGLSLDQRTWVASRPKFLLPVKALSDRFRTCFKKGLAKQAPDALQRLPAHVWRQRWVVHSQAAGSGEAALAYLSRYVFKTATGDRSVSQLADGSIRWPYRESQTGQSKHVDLEPFELIRRFLQHVLPRGYTRVRCFGWFHPAGRKKLNRVRALLDLKPLLTAAEQAAWQPPEGLVEPAVVEASATKPAPVRPCPRCGQPLQWVASWLPGQKPPRPDRPDP